MEVIQQGLFHEVYGWSKMRRLRSEATTNREDNRLLQNKAGEGNGPISQFAKSKEE